MQERKNGFLRIINFIPYEEYKSMGFILQYCLLHKGKAVELTENGLVYYSAEEFENWYVKTSRENHPSLLDYLFTIWYWTNSIYETKMENISLNDENWINAIRKGEEAFWEEMEKLYNQKFSENK